MAETPIKFVAGADLFGTPLKDALVDHLRSLDIEVEDLGTGPYYSISAEVGSRVSSATETTRGLLACGTGCGVSMFANKFPGVFAATCLTVVDARSISNVISFSGMATPAKSASEILDAWLKAPCLANDDKPWLEDIQTFLNDSLTETPKIGAQTLIKSESESCTICCLVKNRKLNPIDIIPGGSMKIIRESPTSVIVRFKVGIVEPVHHHTFGHDLVVMEGRKRVWNLTKKEKYDLEVEDYLFTPAGDVHRVKYFEDTEFNTKPSQQCKSTSALLSTTTSPRIEFASYFMVRATRICRAP